MHIWILVFALLLFSNRDATAQAGENSAHEVEIADLTPPLPIDRITEELPPGNVRAIAQDGTGFIWVGTEEGLARFDGHEFVKYSGQDARSGFTERFVSSMATDLDGRLWVGTGVGLFVYDPSKDTFSQFDLGDSPGDSISTLFADSKNRLWVGYTTGGRSLLDGGNWKHLVDEDAPTRFRESKAGFWLATEESGVILLSDLDKPIKSYSLIDGDFKGDENKRYLASSSIRDLLVEKDKYLWIATADAGLQRLDIATGEIRYYDRTSNRNSIISDNLFTLAMDHNGELWIGADDGLSLYQAKTDDFLRFQTEVRDPKSLGFNFVTSSFVDAGGVLWLGQFARGISKFHPDARNTRLYQSYLTGGQNPTSFGVGAGDVMWVGTYNGGLWAFDWKKGTRTGYYVLRDDEGNQVDLADNWITSILPEGEGLWFTTNNAGLVYFHPPSGRFQSFNTENSEIAIDYLESLTRGPNNMLWMGSQGGGLLNLDPETGEWKSWTAAQLTGLVSPDIFALRFDEDGEHLWLGSAEGLLKYNLGTNTGTLYESVEDDPETLPGRQVFALLQVGTTMWVATTDGLGQLDMKTGKVRRWQEADGLSNQTVYGLLEADGLIWLTTNGGGLQSLDPETGTFHTFLGGDGMQGREYSSGAYLKTADGTLVFGGHEGYNMFKPSDLNRAIDIGPVVITGVDVANKPFSFSGASWNSKKVSMEHSSGIVKFSFAALGFAAPELVHYQYRLKGFGGDEWQEASAGQRSATYTNLDQGDYHFEIKAQDRQGKWSEPTSIKLHVEPPMYKTWWAFLIYAAIIGAGIALYLKYQREKLAALQQQNRLSSVEKDLELTGAVQTGFLPTDAGVSAEAFALLGFYRPAESCSGDWWWHESQPGGRYTVLVGDVTGHGPGPAMVTAAVATAYRVQSQFSGSMDERLRVLNEEVLRVSGGKYQMTLTALTLDLQTGKYEIHSAGGLPVMTHEGVGGQVKSIPCRGTPLGTANGLIGSVKGQLSPGSRVLLYTDGIPEIEMANGRQIGMRRFAKLFGETSEVTIPLASRRIVETAEVHLSTNPQDDDWTFAILQWSGPQRQQPQS